MYFPYYYYWYDPTYILIIIGFIITFISSAYMNITFKKYQRVRSKIGLSASEVAKRILYINNLLDVPVGHVPGNLTDHYAPTTKQLNLSDTTYDSTSIASIGVAAHECGHAIQDSTNFLPLVLQLSIRPIVSFASQLSIPLILIGILLSMVNLAKIGVIAFLITFLYQILTLPIEFDASRRAIITLEENQILNNEEIIGVKKVLTAAALTYVAAAATTLLQFLRLLIILSSGRGRRE